MTKKGAKKTRGNGPESKAGRDVGRSWIKERIKAVGKTQKEVANAIGIYDSRLTDKIKGKRDFESKEIALLARELQLPFELVYRRLTGLSSEDIESNIMVLEVRGEAKAGLWNKTAEWPPNVWEYIMAEKEDIDYAGAAYGLRVTGDDMDKFYPAGRRTAICVPYVYYKDGLREQDYVVVQRADGNGQYETTIKQIVKKGDHVWLEAPSSNPDYRPIELRKTDEATEYYGTPELKIVGVVLKAVVDIPTPKTKKNRELLPEAL